ncbi:MAG: zinc-ribbon domain-containing protein, partial [Pseudomonadota bacterium]
MRLICPSCGAQYDIDDHVMPSEGRDVQCSNCGHSWFQAPPAAERDLAAELGLPAGALKSRQAREEAAQSSDRPDQAPSNLFIQRVRQLTETSGWDISVEDDPAAEKSLPDPKSDTPPPPTASATPASDSHKERNRVDNKVLKILREEAEREQAARSKESHIRAVPDPEPDEDPKVGGDNIAPFKADRSIAPRPSDPPNASRPSDRLGAAIADASKRPRKRDEASVVAPMPVRRRTRSELLPDVDEVTSTLQEAGLSPDAMRSERAAAAEVLRVEHRNRRRAQGFRLGFALALMIVTALLLTY